MTEIMSEINIDHFSRRVLFTPEKNLLVAMLERALLDFLGNQKLESEDATEWLFYDDDIDQQCSFSWVCLQLDLAPTEVRRNIHRMKRLGETSAGRWWGIRRRA